MSKFYSYEAVRAEMFRQLLEDIALVLTPSKLRSITTNTPSTDGDASYYEHHYIILEAKQEVGSEGAKPYAQVALYCTYSSEREKLKYPNFNFPCIAITLYGEKLQFWMLCAELAFRRCPPRVFWISLAYKAKLPTVLSC